MMDNHPPKTAPPDENTGPASNRKQGTAQRPASDQTLKCPRCDSPNTKFCYYNNYSLTQPRHFCKTCRRYWTKGGALRNVPIGGGCRKSKKSKSSSSNSSCKDAVAMSSDSILGSAGVGGMKFFPNLSPAMEFHLSGLPFSRLHSSAPPNGFSNFFSFGDLSSAAPLSTNSPSSAFEPVGTSSTSLMGFNYPISSVLRNGEGGIFSTGIQEMGCSSSSSSSTSSINLHSNLASSIESLSSINQDLHWKLQQQRLAMLFGGENQKDGGVSAVQAPLLENHQIPISLQMQESLKIDAGGSNSKRGCGGENASEWFFGSSYSAGNGNSNGNNTSNWSEIQAWNDLQQYSALP